MEKGDGMSFAEFTYPVLQSWDWWYMYETKGIQLQIGGSDQYGNIIAGIDAVKYIAKNHYDPLIRQEKEDKMRRPIGFTTPLLTSSSGEKFGKSAGNAIWLDGETTSIFDLYQVFPPSFTDLATHLTSLEVLLTISGHRRGTLPQAIHIYATSSDQRDHG